MLWVTDLWYCIWHMHFLTWCANNHELNKPWVIYKGEHSQRQNCITSVITKCWFLIKGLLKNTWINTKNWWKEINCWNSSVFCSKNKNSARLRQNTIKCISIFSYSSTQTQIINIPYTQWVFTLRDIWLDLIGIQWKSNIITIPLKIKLCCSSCCPVGDKT